MNGIADAARNHNAHGSVSPTGMIRGTLAQTTPLQSNRDRHDRYCGPCISRAKLLSNTGNCSTPGKPFWSRPLGGSASAGPAAPSAPAKAPSPAQALCQTPDGKYAIRKFDGTCSMSRSRLAPTLPKLIQFLAKARPNVWAQADEGSCEIMKNIDNDYTD